MPIKNLRLFILATITITLCTAFGFPCLVSATVQKQKKLVAKKVKIITKDGLEFKDLNKNGKLDLYEDWRASAEDRADNLLSQMTLREKAGLMVHPPLNMNKGGALSKNSGWMNVQKKINHVLTRSKEGPEILALWNNNLQELAEGLRLGIPITISSDPRNIYSHNSDLAELPKGMFSQWPSPLGLAATRDVELVKQSALIAAKEYRAVGFRTALHPMADLATEPRWGRIYGTFGEDANLAARLTAAYIKGFQGDNGLDYNSVITMTKHFPGGGPQLKGLDPHNDYGKEQVYPGGNFEYHLIPFKAAIKAKTAQMMLYYGIPIGITKEKVGMAFNREIVDLLRKKMGYNGVICSDWGIILGMNWGVESLSVSERYKKAIDAGIDQLGDESKPEIIVDLVNRKQLTEQRVNDSARRLLIDKFKIGLFENPYVDPAYAKKIVGCQEFQKAGDIAQRRSIVLLTNKEEKNGKALPLKKGIKIYLEGVNFTVAKEYGTVVGKMEDADIAIVRVKTPFQTGNRPGFAATIHFGNLAFKGKELEHLQTVMKKKPTVVSVFLDRPAVIPEIVEEAAAVIGTFGVSDRALLDVIFGSFAPTGKLPFEMPSSMAAVEKQKEDVPYDSENPLFRFGHGLTY